MFWNKDSRRKYEDILLGALKAVEFWLKAQDKEISDLKETIRQVDDARILTGLSSIVECEVCGCLLKKATARKGKDELRYRPINVFTIAPVVLDPWPEEAYVYTPYYCKIHAPKEET